MKRSCHSSTVSTVARASSGGVGSHRRLVGVAAHPERDDSRGDELGETVEHAREGVVQHRAVVQTGTDDDLAMDLDAVVEQSSAATAG